MARDKLNPAIRKARHQWLVPLVAKYADGDLQEFAGKVDIDRSTVSLLYNDRREVSDKYAIRISNRLHIDPPKDMALSPVVNEPPAPVAIQPMGNDGFAHERAQYLQIIDRLTRRLDDLSALSVKVDQLIREGKLSQ